MNIKLYVSHHFHFERLLIWNSVVTQNFYIHLYSYKTETAIFRDIKHEKINMTGRFEILASNTIKN